jgi:hypothetical protein
MDALLSKKTLFKTSWFVLTSLLTIQQLSTIVLYVPHVLMGPMRFHLIRREWP